MIDPVELRTWLIAEMESENVDAPDESVRDICRAHVDAFLRVGERFEVLSQHDTDVAPILKHDEPVGPHKRTHGSSEPTGPGTDG
jgi:hypothetical protein